MICANIEVFDLGKFIYLPRKKYFLGNEVILQPIFESMNDLNKNAS